MRSSSRSFVWLRLVVLGLFVLVVVRTGYSIYQVQTTGILNVSTAQANATISITQANKTAVLLGKGSVHVRLKPGIYQVAAKYSGGQSYATTTITKGRTTTTRINPAASAQSAFNIVYANFGTLLSHGLSEEQISYLQQMLTTFASHAKTFTIQADSVARAPRDPNSNSPFEVDCQITIDGATYDAALTYPDDTVLQLTLTDTQTNTQVYLGREPSSPDS